jgi:hypothetical protein
MENEKEITAVKIHLNGEILKVRWLSISWQIDAK